MKIELAFLNGKLARRVVLLFFISALVPVVLLASLSLREINQNLTAQTYEQLRQRNKQYGLALLERLLLLKAQLDWLAQGETSALQTGWMTSGKGFGFKDLRILSEPARTLPGDPLELNALLQRERAALAAGHTRLISEQDATYPARLYLVRQLGPQAQAEGFIVAEIDRAFLFGDPNALGQEMRLLVLDEDQRLLFDPQGNGEPSAEERQRISWESSGHFLSIDAQGQPELISYWSVFLKPNFLVKQWTVVSRAAKTNVLDPVTHFRSILGIVMGLTIAIVALLSILQIRRSLVPLERIMEGVQRIARRDLAHPVMVQSGDEFEELAESVNRMAETIDRQFHTLSTMADIDRLILSSLKIEDIVRIVLTRMCEIIPHDHIAMTILAGPGDSHCHSLGHANLGKHVIEVSPLEVGADDIAALGNRPWRIADTAREPVPSYARTLVQLGARAFLVLPLIVKEEVAAIICLGYAGPAPASTDELELARDFANRVAVALANASWEEQLYYLAHYDTLTGLPNRLLLKDRMRQALASAERQQSFVAVLFIDLDRFKNVNDSLGHVCGDYLLREVAKRLLAILREEDTVCRLGGDEFVILVQPPGPQEASLDKTARIAQKILVELSRPFSINDREIISTASIGIACYPTDGGTATELLKNADSAMYHAKSIGKDTYQFYSRILNAEALERLDLENALRHAQERQELEVFYQPKLEISSGRIAGAEALLRWRHPRLGMVSPAHFIPICEEIGLIIPIGEWVIRRVCTQIREWIEAGLPAPRIAVNLSPVQFRQPELIEMVVKALEESGLSAAHLELEITEGAAMENIERSLAVLTRFRELAIPLNIDDFGTGHSSLSYLKRFPITTLKIDRSFIRNLQGNTKDAAIVTSIITLAHSLGFSVVAEGVETQEQLESLRELGCDVAQGYLISQPIPADAFAHWMTAQTAQAR